ncbi:MAG: NADPH-dependent FMN reductase [Acidimicrobiales bacterium]|jgi:chromate reductase|nr:NADPH-dependent FMN reductase [Acidimicrobiales bacterium]
MASLLTSTFLVGSLRSSSLNKAAATHAARILNQTATIKIPDLGLVPLYNQDIEDVGDPGPVTDLKNAVLGSELVVIFSPEYNYGIPGALKNAIDWLSRPFGAGCLLERSVGIVSITPSSAGGENVREQLLTVCQALSHHAFPTTLGVGGVSELQDGELPDGAKSVLDHWLADLVHYAAVES